MIWLYRGLIFLPIEATYFLEVFRWYFIWSQAQFRIFRAGSSHQATHQACLLTRLVCLNDLNKGYIYCHLKRWPRQEYVFVLPDTLFDKEKATKNTLISENSSKLSLGFTEQPRPLNNRSTTQYKTKTECSLLIECCPRSSSLHQSLMEVWYLWILKVTRPSFFFWGGGGYHPTLKLSGIPTFTFIVSLTHRMGNI